ncbi:SHOCT domain-containing protein [Nocardioides sp. MH1]|uniref:SHOCT domain-containing protein n=1 Tax=Nocardioides sp. MH1 TaxID=3242490 RepID=UPI00351FCDFE
MSVNEVNPRPGWNPDPETGGTRYWNGSQWLATRPKRRPFAAPSFHKGWGIGLLAVGVLAALTSPAQLFSDDAGSTTADRIGTFFVALVVGCVCTAVGVYLLRGQGPTDKQVHETAARAAGSERLVQQQAFMAPPTAPPASMKPTVSDAAAVAQINALSNPETATSLRNLRDLMETGILSEAEYQAAKKKLLGLS